MTTRAGLGSRLVSWGWDYLVVVAWLALLFVVVGVPQLLGWWDLSEIWSEQWQTDLAITLLTVVPYLLYLVLTETSAVNATWGKRKAGLRIVAGDKNQPRLAQVLVRNLVKVLPWQLGHMGAVRLIASAGVDQVGTWLSVLSMVVVVAIVVPILLGKPGVHDLLAGTRVVSTQTQG